MYDIFGQVTGPLYWDIRVLFKFYFLTYFFQYNCYHRYLLNWLCKLLSSQNLDPVLGPGRAPGHIFILAMNADRGAVGLHLRASCRRASCLCPP